MHLKKELKKDGSFDKIVSPAPNRLVCSSSITFQRYALLHYLPLISLSLPSHLEATQARECFIASTCPYPDSSAFIMNIHIHILKIK